MNDRLFSRCRLEGRPRSPTHGKVGHTPTTGPRPDTPEAPRRHVSRSAPRLCPASRRALINHIFIRLIITCLKHLNILFAFLIYVLYLNVLYLLELYPKPHSAE